ncbi:ATP-dependent metallopeptidase FtsH/Yme1/Tma family protein, partial [Microvirga sp. 3-52]|nr:ATP-dependent metallopeptidase FtsH/Yme1/Tma family protein [Microvirga sp. 3-52]
MNRILRYFLLYGLIFLALMGIFGSLNKTNPKIKPITYNEFRLALEEGNVKSATIQPDQLIYEVKGEMKGYKDGETF